MSEIVLHDYWRSSASYRVRIALNLAGVPFTSQPVNLLAGEHRASGHLALNPQGLVPALAIDGLVLTQSLAIIEYLDETRGCGFLPDDPPSRARVRALADVIAMDIHPVCNLSVVKRVADLAGGGDEMRANWMVETIRPGLVAFETLLRAGPPSRFCGGERPGLADICLVPQVYNARRWGADISDLPRINDITARCEEMAAFAKSHPDLFEPRVTSHG